MLLFDWKKVYDTAEGNIARCNLIMEMLVNQQSLVTSLTLFINIHTKTSLGRVFSLMGSFCFTILISTPIKNYVYTMP